MCMQEMEYVRHYPIFKYINFICLIQSVRVFFVTNIKVDLDFSLGSALVYLYLERSDTSAHHPITMLE